MFFRLIFAKRSLVCSTVPSRPTGEIRDQVCRAFNIQDISIQQALKVGTIGEVSIVQVAQANGEKCCAVKTINPEQKRLFETDFEIFASGLMSALNGALTLIEKVSSSAKLVRPLVQQVVNIGNDCTFKANTMNEFDLRVEAKNMGKGSKGLRLAASVFGHPEDYFRVPGVLQIAQSGEVMLMELDEGETLKDVSLSSSERKLITEDLLKIFVHGLVSGPILHADMHPGNVLVTKGRPGLTLVDWGLVLPIPSEKRLIVHELLMTLLRPPRQADATLETLFKALGVVPKGGSVGEISRNHGSLIDVADSSEAVEGPYTQLGKFYDIVAGANGDLDISGMLRVMHDFDWPDWVLLWQKSTGALVNSLAHIKAPEVVDIRIELVRLLGQLVG
eukprot:TRINITY_DN62322_c0_g1_i1.p1 TRINITY_DN62322_c0_g1~~TRINITY_DN62322_c0_g1_i1.p1  ORF type:complete len:390 (-),score=62.51 TRINITY_DN62322_c0_g1_i1:46-1215(-)